MKRKQVLAIGPLGSTLVVENEADDADGKPRIDTYVMKRFSTASWTPLDEQQALEAYDRLIDFDPPVQHLVQHHSVVIQRNHINLVLTYHQHGSLQHFVASRRASRLATAAPVDSPGPQQSVVPPDNLRSWFIMAAVAVMELHQHKMIHGSCTVSNLLLAETPSEGSCASVVLGAAHALPHIVARLAHLMKTLPRAVDSAIAPEVRCGLQHTEASDCYLLGVCMTDLVLLSSLASPFAPDELICINPVSKAGALGDSNFRRFVMTMLDEDPAKRPSIREVISAASSLDWAAAICAAHSEKHSPSPSRVLREVSPQPQSPVRNGSVSKPLVFPEDNDKTGPTKTAIVSPLASRRSASADSTPNRRISLVDSGSTAVSPDAAAEPPQGSAGASRRLRAAPRATGGDDSEWHRRTTESISELERAVATVKGKMNTGASIDAAPERTDCASRPPRTPRSALPGSRQPGASATAPVTYHTLRTMSKAQRMQALEIHGRLQQEKSEKYEAERERRMHEMAAAKRDDDERFRLHKQHMQKIKEQRRGLVIDADRKRANGGPCVEIFVHTPSRGPVKTSFEEEEEVGGDSGTEPAPHHGQRPGGPSKPVFVIGRNPVVSSTSVPEGMFFVPFPKRSSKRTGGTAAVAEAEDEAPRAPITQPNNDAADDKEVLPEPGAVPQHESTGRNRSPSRRSGTTRTSELFTGPSSEDETRHEEPLSNPAPATPSANHGVAHPSSVSAHTSRTPPAVDVVSPSPAPMSASKLPQPAASHETRGVHSLRPSTHDSSTTADHSSVQVHAVPRRNERRIQDSELVPILEWNVDLILRQLRRYVGTPTLDEALAVCRSFARGATEARTNPRANAALMTRIALVIGDENMIDCGPLLSQFIALDATLATAQQLCTATPSA